MKAPAFFRNMMIILLAGWFIPFEAAALPLPDSLPYTCVAPCEDPHVNIFSGTAGIGNPDPGWIVSGPGIPPAQAVGTGLPAGYGWPDPFTGTNWISVAHPPNAGYGLYTFDHAFELSPNCQNPCLTLCVQVDDSAAVRLNGNLIGSIVEPGSVTTCNPSFFNIGGINNLTIEVMNNPAIYMGLDVRGWICCEPDTTPVINQLYCGDSIWDENNTSAHISQFNTYVCAPGLNYTPPDVCYNITVSGPAWLHVTLTPFGPHADLDLYLLPIPNAAAPCLDFSNSLGTGPETIHYFVPSTQNLFLIVDGKLSPVYQGIGVYNLTVHCVPVYIDSCTFTCNNPAVPIITGVPGVGLPDPAWTVTLPGGITQAAVGTILPPGTGWGPPYAGTNWISTGHPPFAPSGVYVFHHQFFIDSLCQFPCIEMCVQVDDTAVVVLNGNVLGTIAHSGYLMVCENFFFNFTGPNNLDFHVVNDPGIYVGLNVKALICCNTPAPEIPIQCADDLWDNNTTDGGTLNHFNGYNCDPWIDHSPPDKLYVLTVNGPCKLDISITNYGDNADLDLFLLSSPLASACITNSSSYGLGPENITHLVPAGLQTYYIVVDGKFSTAYTGEGQFHLVVLCMPLELENCQLPCTDILDHLSSGYAPVGADDPHWTTMIYGPGTPVYVVPPPGYSGDDLPWDGTRWISPTWNLPKPPATYSFFHDFSLNGCIQPSIHLCVKTDPPENVISLYLNGNLIAGPATGMITLDYTSGDYYTMGSDNELRIDIDNLTETWFRLDVQGYVCCDFSLADITGTVSYDSETVSPVTPSILILMSGDTCLDTTFVNTAGNYHFPNVSPGTYHIRTMTALPWGGVNATDALAILRHFTNVNPLTGLKLHAADVNASGYVNTSDALLAAKRFIGLVSSFPAGDWVFTEESFTLAQGESIVHDIRGLCYGDVNASYQPGTRQSPAFNLEYSDIPCRPGEWTMIPLEVRSPQAIGALSLVITYHPDLVEFSGIDAVNIPGDADWMCHISGNEIRISYFTLSHTAGTSLLMNFRLRNLSLPHGHALPFEILYQEVSNDGHGITTPVEYVMPVLFGEDNWLRVYPNPATETAVFECEAEGAVQGVLSLFDYTGRIILEKRTDFPADAPVREILDLSDVPPGICYVRFLILGTDGSRCLTGRFSRVR